MLMDILLEHKWLLNMGLLRKYGDFVYFTIYFTELAKRYSDVVGDILMILTGRDKHLRVPLEILNVKVTKWVLYSWAHTTGTTLVPK